MTFRRVLLVSPLCVGLLFKAAAFDRGLPRPESLAGPYRGRIVVLIDEFCCSATEAFAGVVKETGASTLIGRRTAGPMLGADLVSLVDDWVLVLPVMDFRTAGGARLEGVGVEPDITVKRGRGDPELETALKLLRRR